MNTKAIIFLIPLVVALIFCFYSISKFIKNRKEINRLENLIRQSLTKLNDEQLLIQMKDPRIKTLAVDEYFRRTKKSS